LKDIVSDLVIVVYVKKIFILYVREIDAIDPILAKSFCVFTTSWSSHKTHLRSTRNDNNFHIPTTTATTKLISIAGTFLLSTGASAQSQCPSDVKICPDGQTMNRNPTNDCEFLSGLYLFLPTSWMMCLLSVLISTLL